MKKTKQITITDPFTSTEVSLDSAEELEFYHWCIEGVYSGVLVDYIYHPTEFLLSDTKKYTLPATGKKKNKTSTLFRPHIYTADFKLILSNAGLQLFQQVNPKSLVIAKNFTEADPDGSKKLVEMYIDVKGSFQQFDGARSFTINQKWVYDKFSIFVHKVVPEDLFKDTWVPSAATLTQKTKKVRDKYRGYRQIDQFVKMLDSSNIYSKELKVHLGNQN